MTKTVVHVFSGFLLILLIASAANAQNNDHTVRAMLQNQFGLTQQVIERAEGAMTEAYNYRHIEIIKIALLKSNEHIQIARNRQQMAKRGLDNDSPITEIQAGLILTKSARESAWRAINIIKQASGRVLRMTEENENLVLRQLEKTDNLIERISGNISDDIPPRLLNMFDTARDNQRRAWELYRNQQLRPALKLSRQAEKTLQKAIDYFKSGQTEMRRMTNRLNRLEQNLDHARLTVGECNSEKATKFLKQLQEAYKKCLEYANQGNTEGFNQKEKIAERLLRQIKEICKKENNLQPKLRQLNAELDRLTEAISGTGNRGAKNALDSAREYLHEAERFCADGKTDACAANLKAAQISMRKAKKLAGL